MDSDIWRASISLGQDGSAPAIGASSPVQRSTRLDTAPQVSRDGKRLVFASQRSGDLAIWVSDIDGQNPLQIAAFEGHPTGSPRWSPTGTRVVFDASIEGHYDIFVVGAQGVPQPTRLTNGPTENVTPSWSEDEKWIYFASNRTSRYEVWKVPSDGGGLATRVTKYGGFTPFESWDEKFIYYAKGLEERGIWRVPAEGGEETPVVNAPAPRFWGYWALLPQGIFFAAREFTGLTPAVVEYFDFVS